MRDIPLPVSRASSASAFIRIERSSASERCISTVYSEIVSCPARIMSASMTRASTISKPAKPSGRGGPRLAEGQRHGQQRRQRAVTCKPKIMREPSRNWQIRLMLSSVPVKV